MMEAGFLTRAFMEGTEHLKTDKPDDKKSTEQLLEISVSRAKKEGLSTKEIKKAKKLGEQLAEEFYKQG